MWNYSRTVKNCEEVSKDTSNCEEVSKTVEIVAMDSSLRTVLKRIRVREMREQFVNNLMLDLWERESYYQAVFTLKLALSPSLLFLTDRDIRPWNNKRTRHKVKINYNTAYNHIKEAKDILRRFEFCSVYGLWPFRDRDLLFKSLENEKIYNTDEYVLDNPVFKELIRDASYVETPVIRYSGWFVNKNDYMNEADFLYYKDDYRVHVNLKRERSMIIETYNVT